MAWNSGTHAVHFDSTCCCRTAVVSPDQVMPSTGHFLVPPRHPCQHVGLAERKGPFLSAKSQRVAGLPPEPQSEPRDRGSGSAATPVPASRCSPAPAAATSAWRALAGGRSAATRRPGSVPYTAFAPCEHSKADHGEPPKKPCSVLTMGILFIGMKLMSPVESRMCATKAAPNLEGMSGLGTCSLGNPPADVVKTEAPLNGCVLIFWFPFLPIPSCETLCLTIEMPAAPTMMGRFPFNQSKQRQGFPCSFPIRFPFKPIRQMAVAVGQRFVPKMEPW